jgi:uncharacterized protein (DUF305 family)
VRAPLAGLGLILSLVACEGGGDPVEQALRDASAANHAAMVREGTVSRSAPAAVPDESADQVYVAAMIAHHRSAVAMADATLARTRDPEIRRMAQSARESRMREIAELRAWTPAVQTAP